MTISNCLVEGYYVFKLDGVFTSVASLANEYYVEAQDDMEKYSVPFCNIKVKKSICNFKLKTKTIYD